MRILNVRERTVPISRYSDPTLPSGGLTTSIVAVHTDAVRDGAPVIGYGFSSIGRFGQGGLIRERFAPRLLDAGPAELLDASGTNVDPFRAWDVMMTGEKPGGHGERCVAVGTLDMALWDAAAKIAGRPLYRFLAERLGDAAPTAPVRVYGGGGYPYPERDLEGLADEISRMVGLGYTHAKIKVGAASLDRDLARIDAARRALPDPRNLAVDAMNAYDAVRGRDAATAFRDLDLWWFEDVCDPHDFETQAGVTAIYPGPIAAGEAVFSLAEARLLQRYGGLRPDRDILLFDPAHCYGLPGYLRIVEFFEGQGWDRSAFWPHGGHLFTLHVASALRLGGAEVNPFCFAPFGGLADGAVVVDGAATPPDAHGIGFETKAPLRALFAGLL